MKRHRDFLKMETRQNVISLFIFLLLLAGSCVVRPPLETQNVTREGQFRGIHVPADWWIDLPADNLREHLGKILNSTADSNYNVVLLELPQEETRTSGAPSADAMGDPVEWTIDEARRLGTEK